MKTDFTHCESIYWVFTQLCNDKCDHCYNSSGPQGERISAQDCFRIIRNLPEQVDRLILSGGEPLADRAKLYLILDEIQAKYQGRTQIMLQTNGDLLNGDILDKLIAKGVTRFDIASIDRYHKLSGARLMTLADLFESRGVNGDDHDPLIEKAHYLAENPLSWGYWGATEDMWLGGNWARGRALEKNIWLRDPSHNFCAILSGAKGFLGGTDLPQEISIQLWKINPCCPGTKFPLGDARREKVADVLLRASKSEIMQRLNQGEPWKMGESVGVTEAHAHARTEELQNVCLWCDEFFGQHQESAILLP
ncbi:radical SAM protein [Hymenobacter terricola]|uniref:radical SAM protein n=1 Tax=Hymenobacter terricola TaxID=2819236 RepID=UPI001B30707B|nr:radical SAM protein [Hymenobacter terricola]